MNVILFDDNERDDLLPLSYTRPIAELRTGILTLREKWEKRLNTSCSWKTAEYLQHKFPLKIATRNLFVNAHICPTQELIGEVVQLEPGTGLRWNGKTVAVLMDEERAAEFPFVPEDLGWKEYNSELDFIQYPWDLVEVNSNQIQLDFDLWTQGRKSAEISGTNRLVCPGNIFVEAGAKLKFVTINASAGPVYIGAGAEIMEGALIRGPFALCDHATVNMGSKIYGGTTVGPFSKVGGEISQSVILGYSNKGHDGFLGNSVLGEWCNLGAGTNVSNLKNNYEPVKVWNYSSRRFVQTGRQFCGLIMGDHSKAGINSMFNTGTVVGVGCNIHGAGFPRQFVPSFSDGGASGFKLHQLKSVCGTAEKVMARRGQSLSGTDKQILESIFELSGTFRSF